MRNFIIIYDHDNQETGARVCGPLSDPFSSESETMN